MTTSHKFKVPVVAALALAVVVSGAYAQQASKAPDSEPPAYGRGYGPGYGPGMMGPGRMMGPGMMGGRYGRGLCNPRAAGLAEWRIDRIERIVKLDDTQKKALDEVRATSAKAASQIAQACPKTFPANAAERLTAMENRMEAMLQAIKTVRPAFDAFYGTLNAEQKRQLDRAGPRRWGWERWG